LRFAAYYTAFSIKTHFILLQIAKKRVLVAVSLNKNSFCLQVQLTPFCIKTNLRENRFFAARWAIVGKNCTHNVKFITENKTKTSVSHARTSATTRKKRTPTAANTSCCWVGCSQPTETAPWKHRKRLPLTAYFQL
jgi:hypothetical protein